MALISRKAQPECLRYFLLQLRFPGCSSQSSDDGREESCTVEKLTETLIGSGYTPATAKEAIYNALTDGILVPMTAAGTSPRPRSALSDIKRVRLPNSQEVRVDSSHDWYCFECHLPGGILENCAQCWRSFHRLCYRKNPERPNYAVPSSKQQKNRLPAFSSDNESEAETLARCSTAMGSETDVRASSSQRITADQTQLQDVEMLDMTCINQTEPKPLLDDFESKTKVDVVCIGEIRPPNRRRPNTTASNVSYKSEVSPNDDEDQDFELCTCCRLLKRAHLNNPPNLQPDELSHLINFTFSYNKEWLTHDVREYLTAKRLNLKEINLVDHLLLYSPIKRLADIDIKMERNEYNFLTELLVDLLDIQHNMGVFFGPHSTELESTKWLLRDVAHDLSEIRRCPDCFRYSHEKDSVIWFAKPCVQRHELVYAKHSGFPYWPAKVIRVLPNNKFDVRFFGGNHSRALIDVRHIKPIDSDVKSLKLGNSPAIKKAMEELRYHQLLSTYPPSLFSFHANPHETEKVIQSVLGSNPTAAIFQEKRAGRRRKSAIVSSSVEDEYAPIVRNTSHCAGSSSVSSPRPLSNSQSSIVCPELTVSVKRLKVHQYPPFNQSSKSSSSNDKRSTRTSKKKDATNDTAEVLDTMLKEMEEARKIINEYKQKNKQLEAQKQKLKEKIKKQELESKILKRKLWCYWCLDEAIYLCCFRAAYCSEICQSRHWKDGHSKVCKNPTNGSNTNS
ncbi:zinc finger MYND domain-containing protein 11-like [Musca autumnalis]|uniref:zinc finger MYND domain-containing protein 11-like n=1 Tax=Musca autumnalis TaxID=221902 RepID=UPI003CED4D21